MKNKQQSNSWAIAPQVQEIQSLLSAGDLAAAHKHLKLWLKKNSPRPFERIKISEYYTWMGLNQQAAKILGPPLSKSELAIMSAPELCIQLRLAYVLGMMGAKYVALGLMKSVREYLDERGEEISHHYPQFYQNYAYLHLTYYLTAAARWGFESALSLYPKSSYQYFYISLGLADCDAFEGKIEASIHRTQELILSRDPKEALLSATAHQALGEYLGYAGKHAQARAAFEKSFQDFGEQNKSKDFAYLLKHSGLGHLWSGQREAGLKELLAAKKLLERPDQTPLSLIEILFWLEHFAPEMLSRQERICLRAYPNYSIYSLQAGRLKKEVDHTSLPPWVPSLATTKREECWLIEEREIRSCHYEVAMKAVGQGFWLDLDSSFIFKNGKIVKSLSELQAKVLIALAGAGERGVHQYLLTDFIYQQEFTNWETGLDRIKKAVKSLGALGLKINSKNLNYIWQSENFNLILPTSLKPSPGLHYAKLKLKDPFGSEQLAANLGVSQRTAQRLIKEWQGQGHIRIGSGHTYHWSE